MYTLASMASWGHVIFIMHTHTHTCTHIYSQADQVYQEPRYLVLHSVVLLLSVVACCLCILIEYICHKKGKTLTRSHCSLQPQASQSHALNSHPYTAQELTNTSQTYQSSIAELQQTDIEPSTPPPPLEAVTHAGEAPPSYHTAVHYKTVHPDTEDVRSSSACTLTESDAPPVYKGTQDWKQ